MALINRLRPVPLESLDSLLQRLRLANHYQERAWLGDLLGRHPARPDVLRRVADFQTLSVLTGLDRDALIELTLHRFAPWYGVAQRPPRPVLPAVLPIALWPDISAQGNTRAAPAVCPACWGDQQVILLPWSLHHLTACPRHQVLLHDRCPGCHGRVWLDVERVDCGRCGHAIAEVAMRSIAADPDDRGGPRRQGVGCVALAGDGVRGEAGPCGRTTGRARSSAVAAGHTGRAQGVVGLRAGARRAGWASGSRRHAAAAAGNGDRGCARGACRGVAAVARLADAWGRTGRWGGRGRGAAAGWHAAIPHRARGLCMEAGERGLVWARAGAHGRGVFMEQARSASVPCGALSAAIGAVGRGGPMVGFGRGGHVLSG